MGIEKIGYSFLTGLLILAAAATVQAAAEPATPLSSMRQLDELLPTPNDQRTASGAPGKSYWQQRADYVIDARLDERRNAVEGRETVTYHNASPDILDYLWVQLDQNRYAHGSSSRLAERAPDLGSMGYGELENLLNDESYQGEMTVSAVTDAGGAPLPHMINETVMRIDLPEPLAPGKSVSFSIAWSFVIPSDENGNGRTGYQVLDARGNAVYSIAQWFPRMAAYTDVTGWQVKQFLGQGEFTLEFGDYLVRLEVPADHVVAATGTLQNAQDALTPQQRERWKKAETATAPVLIVTPEEAKRAESGKASGRKTWVYQAQNVRDFAFASSRKFVWDAMAVPGQTWKPADGEAGERPVMAMSFYPSDAGPLWPRYSTHALAHALDVYSRHTFPYPYPYAISVAAGFREGGMEYPMIAFNATPRYPDGRYTEADKFGFISLVVHEAGHNYFPMIVNSDERQWTWMDEGLNVFLEYLANVSWQKGFPLLGDTVSFDSIREAMKRDGVWPIMTASDDYPPQHFVHASYPRTAAALVALRESVLGRERFDFAFRTYARRWMFKRPHPADFFRTMEDASGVDLDWFWRGWFYGSGHVDLAVNAVRQYRLDTQDPVIEKARAKREKAKAPVLPTERLDAAQTKYVDRHPELKDFYDRLDPATVLPSERDAHRELLELLRGENIDPALLRTERNFYTVEIGNVGGIVMPFVLRVVYGDGSREDLRIPAQIWAADANRATKLLMTSKTVASLELDPDDGLFDADRANNAWPPRLEPENFQLEPPEPQVNPMKELQGRP
jgi:hypothetical protein